MFCRPKHLRRAIVLAAGVSLTSVAGAQATLPGLPDTPPGRLMSAWITAINSADREKIQAFLDKSWPSQPMADNYLARAKATGGYDVGQILQSTDTRLSALLRKRTDTTAYNTVTVTVAPNAPDRVANIGIGAGTARAAGLSTPTTLAGAALDAAKAGAPHKLLTSWLDAFNSGDKSRLESFLAASWPSATIDAQAAHRERTGGFEQVVLESAAPTVLIGTMKEKGGDGYVRFTLSIDAPDATRIARLAFTTIAKP
jgi:hypothetical protein